ncbi:MAG: hypothetical protein ACRDMH_09310 [Solirubrobacterales bacterium]
MGPEVAEQATKRRGRVRRFMAWLGYGLEIHPEQRSDRDARRTRRKAEVAERRERQRADRLARKEARRRTSDDLDGLRLLVAEMESRARFAEQQVEEARARVTDAQSSADRARAAAEEARHGIGVVSTELAQVEAERRLHEQAERRLVARCAELGGELKLERKEKTATVEDLDRRLATIEETAEAATKRVAVARAVAHPGGRIAGGSAETGGSSEPNGLGAATVGSRPADRA